MIIHNEMSAAREDGKPAKQKRKGRAQIACEAPNEHGRFIIDSAANPNFLCRPPKIIEPLTSAAMVNTANGNVC